MPNLIPAILDFDLGLSLALIFDPLRKVFMSRKGPVVVKGC